MTVFIWERIQHCSDHYHEEGGVVVFAKDEARAIELATLEGCEFKVYEKPDYAVQIESEEEKVFIFPDAGCC